MRRVFAWTTAVTLTLGLAACASSGGGAGSNSSFRSDMGRLLAEPVAVARQKVWAKHNIPLYREETAFRSIVYESEWMPREPTPAEAAAGVTDARNRIVLRGRRVEGEMDVTTGVYRVTFELDNQVVTALNPDWHPAAIPDQVVRDYRRVLSDLELELRSGVRR